MQYELTITAIVVCTVLGALAGGFIGNALFGHRRRSGGHCGPPSRSPHLPPGRNPPSPSAEKPLPPRSPPAPVSIQFKISDLVPVLAYRVQSSPKSPMYFYLNKDDAWRQKGPTGKVQVVMLYRTPDGNFYFPADSLPKPVAVIGGAE